MCRTLHVMVVQHYYTTTLNIYKTCKVSLQHVSLHRIPFSGSVIRKFLKPTLIDVYKI